MIPPVRLSWGPASSRIFSACTFAAAGAPWYKKSDEHIGFSMYPPLWPIYEIIVSNQYHAFFSSRCPGWNFNGSRNMANRLRLFHLDHEFFHLNNFVWVFYHTVFWLPLLSIEYRLSDFLLPWCCHSKKADQKYTCVQFISLKWYYTISFELSRVSFVHELFRRRFNLQSIEF